MSRTPSNEYREALQKLCDALCTDANTRLDYTAWMAAQEAKALLSRPESVEPAEAREWRPIRSAPDNGKWVQLWWPAVTDVPFTGYCLDSVWRAATSGDWWPSIPGPTHWMPLPSPPAASDGENT